MNQAALFMNHLLMLNKNTCHGYMSMLLYLYIAKPGLKNGHIFNLKNLSISKDS